MGARSQHVVPRGGKWAVRKAGSEKVTRRFDTQREAIEATRRIARNQGGEVFIYGGDGRIRERDSLANDSLAQRCRRTSRRQDPRADSLVQVLGARSLQVPSP